jgi:hypothetical protein
VVTVRIPSDTASSLGRATHDVALGALLGANLFGRIALSPALEAISDKAERGQVLNRAWRRYGTVNSLALAALVGGWLPARLGEAAPRWLSERERRLAVAKDVAMGAVVVTGLAAGASGLGFATQAPAGAVPMQSGHDTAPETPSRAAHLKRAANVLGALNLASEVALVGINASLSQANFRRPPVRRLLRQRY